MQNRKEKLMKLLKEIIVFLIIGVLVFLKNRW